MQISTSFSPRQGLRTPVLTAPVLDTESSTYHGAYTAAFNLAQRFRGAVPVWELGNEANTFIFRDKAAFDDNSDPVKFQRDGRYPRVLALFRGLHDGVRDADETTRIAVGDSGGCNYGFTQALYNDGLRWDITVVHLYDFWGEPDNRGTSGAHCALGDDMLWHHTQYNKPIWITEFNYTPATQSKNKDEMSSGIQKMMNRSDKLWSKYDIEAADVYELCDEQNKGDKEGPERHFGLLTSEGRTTSAAEGVHGYIKANGSKTYDTSTATKTAYFAPFTIKAGQSITKNELRLQMQTDGNFIVGDTGTQRVVWSTGTDKRSCSGCVAKFQGDGNFVLYDANGRNFWSTNTGDNRANAFIVRSDSTRVQLKDGKSVVWKSN